MSFIHLTVEMDDFENKCCGGVNPILDAVNQELRGVKTISAINCQKPAPVKVPEIEVTTIWEDGTGIATTERYV